MNLIIGCHVSFLTETGLLGSVKEALSYNANTFMIYTGSNRSYLRNPINKDLVLSGYELMKSNNIDINNVVVHAPYIINLANNSDEKKYSFYINFLKKELNRCIELGISKIVLHPGSYVNLSKSSALENIVFGLDKALEGKKNIMILLEFMSGKGSEIGNNLDDIKYILDNTKHNESIGVCLDTCHMNDSGVDLNEFDKFLDEFDNLIGISKIKCIHVNDSYNEISIKKDRHANIGYGRIGFSTLINCIYNERLKDVPKILETPWYKKDGNEYPPYKYEIEAIRNKIFSDFINL